MPTFPGLARYPYEQYSLKEPRLWLSLRRFYGRNKKEVAITVIVGFLAVLFMAEAAFVYLRDGDPPVATAEKAFPFKKTIVHIPRNACIGR